MKTLKHLLCAVAISPLVLSCSKDMVEANYEVVPLPQQITSLKSTHFLLKNNTTICYPEGNTLLQRDAEFLAFYLQQSTGRIYKTKAYAEVNSVPAQSVVLALNPSVHHEEGYELRVDADRVTISGQTPNGVFYGVQTLRKAIPPLTKKNEQIKLPAVVINDYPRFEYRGMHLDVGRHYFPVEFIKEYIDLLALHNMNVFHWHLTEDQGWRIEIKQYPKLTEIGSKRPGTVIGHNSGEFNDIPVEGFYTQEEIKDIVAYAAERYISIIPEVDLPGHMLAALAAYPEFGCTGGPYEVEKTWGVFDDVICIGNEDAMVFLENVLDEVIGLFPAEYIHIGGDEAPRVRWEKCPKCQARIKTENLKADKKHTAEDRLQSYCMTRIEKFLNDRGRRIIGWDEMLEGDVAPNATVMSWRGVEQGAEAARLGHDVIMTPTSFLYLDYYQSQDTQNEPIAIGGYVPIEKVYSFDPQLDELTEEEKKKIIGVQANLWTEYIPTTEQVEYMVLPRMAAVAEVQWTMPGRKDYKRFAKAATRLMNLYERDGLNYATHIYDISDNFVYDAAQKAVIAELMTIDDAPVYYTLDGTEPGETSALYTAPLTIKESAHVQAVAIRNGKKSRILSEKVNFNKATGKPVSLKNNPSPKYTYEGASTLVDALRGGDNYATGRWLGFLSDVEAVIDLGEPTEISQVATEALADHNSWVMGATELTVEISDNGKTFRKVVSESYPASKELSKKGVVEYVADFAPVTATFVKVIIKPTLALPEGHAGAGGKPFMFIDEIRVN